MFKRFSTLQKSVLSVFILQLSITVALVHSWDLNSISSAYLAHDKALRVTGAEVMVSTQRSYLKETSAKWDFPLIPNLNLFLNNLVTDNGNPIVVIDNFRKINLAKINTPIIVRNPVPVVHRKVEKWGETVYLISLGANTVKVDNISLIHNTSLCEASKFLAGLHEQFPCFQILLSEFAFLAKPFSFSIHMGLFPSEYIFEINSHWVYPSIFKRKMNLLPTYFATPSYSFPVNCIVLQKNQKAPFSGNIFYRWMESLKDTSQSSYFHDTFLVLVTSFASNNLSCDFNKSPFFSTAYIQDTFVLQACPNCARQVGKEYGKILLARVKPNVGRKGLSPLAFQHANYGVVWCPIGHVEKSLLSTVLYYSQKCQSELTRKFWKKYFEPGSNSFLDKVALGHSHVWNSVMRNASVLQSWRNRECTKPGKANFVVTFTPKAYLSSRFTFPRYAKDNLAKLRIVGCGRKGLDSFQFKTLANVYDKSTWLGILASMVAFPLAIWILLQNNIKQSSGMSVVKLLLEQGDPFPNSITRVKLVRIMLGLLLLMGIVLSNGYKNTNVYNMVVPRKPILYKYFKELLKDSFNIYTRSMNIDVASSGFSSNLLQNTIDKYVETIGNYSFVLVSEVKSVANEYEYQQHYFNAPVLTNSSRCDQTLVESGILKFTWLHRDVLNLFKKLLQERISNHSYQWYEAVQVGDKMHQEIRKKEEVILQEALQECKKTALILSDHVSRDVYKTLSAEMHKPYAFLGEESFSDIDWTLSISGLVPPELIKRVHRIGESGIWQWWVELFQGNRFKSSNANQVAAASMAGNIVVVFAIWVVCIVMGILSFLIEYYSRLILCRTERTNCSPNQ